MLYPIELQTQKLVCIQIDFSKPGMLYLARNVGFEPTSTSLKSWGPGPLDELRIDLFCAWQVVVKHVKFEERGRNRTEHRKGESLLTLPKVYAFMELLRSIDTLLIESIATSFCMESRTGFEPVYSG